MSTKISKKILFHEGLQKGGVKPPTSQPKPQMIPTPTAPKRNESSAIKNK